MKFYRETININNKKRKLLVINHEDKDISTNVTTSKVNKLHHIHILDFSGSMRDVINNLIDNVIKTVSFIPEDDIVSIIRFSGPGTMRTIVKGSTRSPELLKLIDGMRNAGGTTCFSEPVKESGIIVKELKALCPNISITLFTDGEACVPWDVKEEENRVYSYIKEMKEYILAFNTIGYGNYYNQKFLHEAASLTEFGTSIHSSKIDQYMEIFERNFKKVSDMVSEKIDVVSDFNTIIYLNRSFTKMCDKTFELSKIDSRKNQFFILGVDDKDFDFMYQGKKYNSGDGGNNIPESTITNFYYACAYNLYCNGRRKPALDILSKNLGDKHLVDHHMNAFTFDEVAEQTERIYTALFYPTKGRYLEGNVGSDYLPAKDALCVMDVLGILSKSGAYYVPFSKNVPEYNRIGRKATDEFNLFKRSDEETIALFKDFTFNKEHINLSVKFEIKGTVKLNPKSAAGVGLPAEIETSMYRQHAIIKDGMLNIPLIEVLIPVEATIPYGLGNIMKLVESEVKTTPVLTNRFVLDLTKLPIINEMYIQEGLSIVEVFKITNAITQMEIKQKVIGYLLDEVNDVIPAAVKEKEFRAYTVEQIRVLDEHGIDKNLFYKGVSVKVPKAEESDSYETRTMEFYISGFKAVPKVSDMLERIKVGKKLTPSMEVMQVIYASILVDCSKNKTPIEEKNLALKEFLSKEVDEVKAILFKLRMSLNILKMAKLLTGDWFDGLKTNDKGEFIYESEGVEMIAKTARTIEYF